MKRQVIVELCVLALVAVAAADETVYPDRKPFDWRLPTSRQLPKHRASRAINDWGEFLADTTATYGPGSGEAPVAAWGAGYWLVVWYDYMTGGIRGTRIGPTGVIVDTVSIAITASGSSPAVTYDGANFLAVWTEFGEIRGARISPAGVVLDPDGFTIAAGWWGVYGPRVASNGDEALVVWVDSRNYETTYEDIYGARVTQDGIVLDPDGLPIGVGPESQQYPDVSFDGENWLVVWQDYRNWFGDIYGARVTPAGVVLDPQGIAIAVDRFWRQTPSVASGPSGSFVVWCQQDDTLNWTFSVAGARVTRTGVVLDPQGIALTEGGDSESQPTIAWTGSNYLVAWVAEDALYETAIVASRVTEQGVRLDPAGIVMTNPAPGRRHQTPRLATGWLVVWVTDDAVFAGRITEAGTTPDPGGFPVAFAANTQVTADASFDGTNYLVAFSELEEDRVTQIYGIRLNATGRQLEPRSFPIGRGPGWQFDAGVAFDGTNFLVVWVHQDDTTYDCELRGARITPAGVVVDTNALRLFVPTEPGTYIIMPDVVFGDTCYLVTWTQYSGIAWWPNVMVGRVSRTGLVLDPGGIPVGSAEIARAYSNAAFDGENWLVVWTDGHDIDYPEIYGTRVSPAGRILDTAGIRISIAPDYQIYPAVSFDGTNYAVAWQDFRAGDAWVYAARVNRTGTVLDPNGIRVGGPMDYSYYRQLAIEFDATDHQLVWVSEGGLRGARLRTNGTIRDTFTILRIGQAANPVYTRGPNAELLLTWTDWAGLVNGRAYNTWRVFGKFGPFPGVTEATLPAGRQSPVAVNPSVFRTSTLIRLPGNWSARIYDVQGRVIREVTGPEFCWNGTDEHGHKLPAGVYLIRAWGDRQAVTGEVRLLR